MAMLFLAARSSLEITAYHVDHGLRPGSAEEGQLVNALCQRLGAAFVQLRADLADGPNLEARARDARRALLPPGVLTGHTADDQAETVMLNLMRGSSTDGLSGMRWSFSKPLLALRRHETRKLCRDTGIDFTDDPTNSDSRFRRNRVRHELMPLMNEIAQRDVAALIARESRLVADDEDFLQFLAETIDVFDAPQLAAAPLPLARRAIRKWLENPYPPDSATVDRVLDVARGTHPACDIGGGRRVIRSRQRLRLQ
jgi:tRNA(Ile)-lysidine synthase